MHDAIIDYLLIVSALIVAIAIVAAAILQVQ